MSPNEVMIRAYVEAFGGDNVSKEMRYLRILLKIIDDLRKPAVDAGQKTR
jgi:hypothetical protein